MHRNIELIHLVYVWFLFLPCWNSFVLLFTSWLTHQTKKSPWISSTQSPFIWLWVTNILVSLPPCHNRSRQTRTVLKSIYFWSHSFVHEADQPLRTEGAYPDRWHTMTGKAIAITSTSPNATGQAPPHSPHEIKWNYLNFPDSLMFEINLVKPCFSRCCYPECDCTIIQRLVGHLRTSEGRRW